MRTSWNFSTAIFEIWVLVLTKPGWANETPTTSLRVPGDYNYHHYEEHEHPDHNQHHHHYTLGASTSRGYGADSNHNRNHQHHNHKLLHSSSSSNYASHNHHNNHNHHLESASSPSIYSQHRCYVCLPPNKNSKEAQQILDSFAKDVRPLIPDCSAFDPYVDTGRFEFDCPQRFGGCILRIHGSNISRACSKYRVNDCKKANSVEFCYCTTPLCNDKKPEPAIIPAVVHVSRNTGRRGSMDRVKSSLRGRQDEDDVNSQGIRTRVSDDEDILSEDYEGSGTGTPDRGNSHSLLDLPTSTLDPQQFPEENFGVAVEDPNPHTKIGISMGPSASSGAAISSKWPLTWRSLLDLTLFLQLFGTEDDDLCNHGEKWSHHYPHLSQLNKVEEESSEKITIVRTSSPVSWSQLCFTISLLLALLS